MMRGDFGWDDIGSWTAFTSSRTVPVPTAMKGPMKDFLIVQFSPMTTGPQTTLSIISDPAPT